MRLDVLIRGGTVVSSEGEHQADVAVKDGKIVEVGALAGLEAELALDASGLLVMPGAIDTQVHFREPGMEHKEDIESGTRAAICGGVTSVLEMPNTAPPTTSRQALEDKLDRAFGQGRAWCDMGFFIGATADNATELAQLEMLPGTPGIKVFMGSSTGDLLVATDDDLLEVLRSGSRRCAVHAEDSARLEERKTALGLGASAVDHPVIRDPECARLATERLLRLSAETGRPVHILHVSTAEELPLIRAAKARGMRTTAEITPQHLFFSAPECYENLGSYVQMNPPIRDRRHQQALRRALQEGLFDVIGSDHAPHLREEKDAPYPGSPSGIPGVQTLLPVMLNFVNEGLLPLRQLVRMTGEAPAAIYGIENKGRITPGFDADIVLADLGAKRIVESAWLQSKCGWSPYEGMQLQGWPIHVLLAGRPAVLDGELQGPPRGKPLVYDWKDDQPVSSA